MLVRSRALRTTSYVLPRFTLTRSQLLDESPVQTEGTSEGNVTATEEFGCSARHVAPLRAVVAINWLEADGAAREAVSDVASRPRPIYWAPNGIKESFCRGTANEFLWPDCAASPRIADGQKSRGRQVIVQQNVVPAFEKHPDASVLVVPGDLHDNERLASVYRICHAKQNFVLKTFRVDLCDRRFELQFIERHDFVLELDDPRTIGNVLPERGRKRCSRLFA